MGALQFQTVGGKGFIGTVRAGWILQGLVVEHPPVKSRDVPWPREPPATLVLSTSPWISPDPSWVCLSFRIQD